MGRAMKMRGGGAMKLIWGGGYKIGRRAYGINGWAMKFMGDDMKLMGGAYEIDGGG